MIIPDWQIKTWGSTGGVEPFRIAQVNPASYDLRIGTDIIWLSSSTTKEILNTKIPTGGFEFWPGDAILATTMEYIKLPPTLAGSLFLKSSLARQGLDHALAGFVDPGFEGQLTMELHFHRNLTLRPGQRICQLVLFQMAAMPDKVYDGRYQGQRGPTEARQR